MPSRKLTDIQELEIIRQYGLDNTLTCPIIARKYNVTDTSIRNIFYKHKVPLEYRTTKKTTGKILNIVNDYNHMNVIQISQKYNITKRHVYHILKSNNIKITRKTNKNLYDEKFFTTPSNEMAYFFGFALGDGTIIIDKKIGTYLISFQIHKKDKSILDQFADWTNFDKNKIHTINKNFISITYSGKEFITTNEEWFKAFGLVQNKTYNPIIPNIPDNLLKPFLCGLIDADGHIKFTYGCNKGYRISLCGNYTIIDWAESSLRRIGFNGCIKKYEKTQNCKVINIDRKLEVFDLAVNILEKDKWPFLLHRKWNQIPKEKDIINKHLYNKNWKWK